MKIAIIDNNQLILKILYKQLKKEYDCSLYTKLKESFFNANFDLVVLDIRLDYQNGLEIAELIRSKIPDQKIIIITGYIDLFEFDIEKYKNYYDKILLKPITKKLLHKNIQEVLYGMG